MNKLIQDGKLSSIKGEKAGHLFYRADVEAKKAELEELRKKYRSYD